MDTLDPTQLRSLSAAILSDVMDSLGLRDQAMRTFVRPLDEGSVLVGRARTGLYMPVYSVREGENPYDIQRDLQEMMQTTVGIIRSGPELENAQVQLDEFEVRVKNIAVKGGRAYNPGWNLATDLPSMLTVSRATATAALLRRESRGGHTREDFPKADPEFAKFNFALSSDGGKWDSPITATESALLPMPDELKALLEEAK